MTAEHAVFVIASLLIAVAVGSLVWVMTREIPKDAWPDDL